MFYTPGNCSNKYDGKSMDKNRQYLKISNSTKILENASTETI